MLNPVICDTAKQDTNVKNQQQENAQGFNHAVARRTPPGSDTCLMTQSEDVSHEPYLLNPDLPD